MLVLCKAIQILESRTTFSVEAKTLLDLWNQKSLKNLELEHTEGGLWTGAESKIHDCLAFPCVGK